VRVLHTEELARESEAPAALIDDLVRIGALKPDAAGRFTSRDIVRVRIAQSHLDAGLTLDELRRAIAEQLFSFDYIDRFYMEPVARSQRTYAEFRADCGPRAEHLHAIYAAFGLGEPRADSHVSIDEEEVLREFLDSWGSVGDRETLLRAARLNGEPIRRIAESIVALCYETLGARLRDQHPAYDELIRRVAEPAARLGALQPRLIEWLERRHTERVMHSLDFTRLEEVFIEHGWTPPRDMRPPAIAFVDLSGFTTMTEAKGDESAARVAGRLQALAESAAQDHRGKLVKLLGDGVMLHFERPSDAVLATLDVVGGAPSAQLPPAHAGVHAGPLIERDGDYYGHTVNLAARILGRAHAGQVVVTDGVVGHVTGEVIDFESLETVSLKGLAQPVELFLATRAAARRSTSST
jgi:adenylate cyclase